MAPVALGTTGQSRAAVPYCRMESSLNDPAPAAEASGRRHRYQVAVRWTGNLGSGTSGYREYSRDHEVTREGREAIRCSSDPAFRGDIGRYNPEELLVASLSTCHMLWYLHLCADAGIVVIDYVDSPVGELVEATDGSGRFREVTLHPRVALARGSDIGLARELHAEAHRMCFVANSVSFPVQCEPLIRSAGRTDG